MVNPTYPPESKAEPLSAAAAASFQARDGTSKSFASVLLPETRTISVAFPASTLQLTGLVGLTAALDHMQTSYMHHPATSQCTIPASPKSFASSILPDGSGRPPLRLVAPSTQSSPCKIVTTTHPTIQWEWLAHSLETHPSAWSSLAATSHAARAATDAIQTILVAMLYMASALGSP
ncbi:hypothetical protein H257_15074 [Aphanomyces astaci]|uniref:Uncharacterized protein n=1 Tax=Aphanomyces astaci TaxID=112090 RepID=W4FR39_APHAT|nr:hypothetical protein H257_15073 [Aphanomyces astaci]XP_009841357.1 hypothetical protein H257_15074 [Aphanomyces astaci]ETV69103.1 hypothetical protein H257_15073 [Aphanomyces astaci]ETV69104.1 hypothetical protein H257_15074 [Aphanomyces astaci]|eukprot:XP_009841356.1 hypothetical protein H257_15073 [Aphanomyces astaci]